MSFMLSCKRGELNLNKYNTRQKNNAMVESQGDRR